MHIQMIISVDEYCVGIIRTLCQILVFKKCKEHQISQIIKTIELLDK